MSFCSSDSSVECKGEVYGIKAQEEYALLGAFAPSLPPKAHTKFVLQMLNAMGLPGTFTMSAKEHSLSYLVKGLHTLATGSLTSLMKGQLSTTVDMG